MASSCMLALPNTTAPAAFSFATHPQSCAAGWSPKKMRAALSGLACYVDQVFCDESCAKQRATVRLCVKRVCLHARLGRVDMDQRRAIAAQNRDLGQRRLNGLCRRGVSHRGLRALHVGWLGDAAPDRI